MSSLSSPKRYVSNAKHNGHTATHGITSTCWICAKQCAHWVDVITFITKTVHVKCKTQWAHHKTWYHFNMLDLHETVCTLSRCHHFQHCAEPRFVGRSWNISLSWISHRAHHFESTLHRMSRLNLPTQYIVMLAVSPAQPQPSATLGSSQLLVVVPYPGEGPFDPRQGTGRVRGGIARQAPRRRRGSFAQRCGETWFWSW